MIKNKIKTAACLLLAFFLLTETKLNAQDIHFSQYNYSSLTLNPALTSAHKDLQATLQYKDQWKSLNAYRTAALSLEMKLVQKKWEVVRERLPSLYKSKGAKGLAFGLHVFSDKAGDGNMKQTQGNFSVAYHILMDTKNTLSAGLSGGVVQRSISPDGLRWNNQYTASGYDPGISSGENFSRMNYVYGDFGAGLLWSFGDGSRYLTANDQKFITAGVSVFHLNRPVQSWLGSSEGMYIKWTGHTNALIGIENTTISIGPSLLFMQQGPQQEFTLGMLVKNKFREESKFTGIIKSSALSLGCYYRNQDALIPYLMIEMNSYSIGMSYDVNLSGLKSATAARGGFEIALRFTDPSPFLYQAKTRFN